MFYMHCLVNDELLHMCLIDLINTFFLREGGSTPLNFFFAISVLSLLRAKFSSKSPKISFNTFLKNFQKNTFSRFYHIQGNNQDRLISTNFRLEIAPFLFINYFLLNDLEELVF